jgi:hypothetical protein
MNWDAIGQSVSALVFHSGRRTFSRTDYDIYQEAYRELFS